MWTVKIFTIIDCVIIFSVSPQAVYVEANEKHKHKFMVQSVVAPEGKTNIDQVVSRMYLSWWCLIDSYRQNFVSTSISLKIN